MDAACSELDLFPGSDDEEVGAFESSPDDFLLVASRSAAEMAAQCIAASKAEMPLKLNSSAVSGALH